MTDSAETLTPANKIYKKKANSIPLNFSVF